MIEAIRLRVALALTNNRRDGRDLGFVLASADTERPRKGVVEHGREVSWESLKNFQNTQLTAKEATLISASPVAADKSQPGKNLRRNEHTSVCGVISNGIGSALCAAGDGYFPKGLGRLE